MTGATILVAEDDPGSSEMLAEMLTMADYTVEVVETGGAALTALRARRFSAVLLDLTMPGMTREELIEGLLDLPASSPLIVYSARPAPEVREIAERLQAAAVLHKPSRMHEMLAAVRQVVAAGG